MDAPALELDQIASAIERGFPDAGAVRPLRIIGSGFRSVAVETSAGAVFLVGQSPDAAGDYAKEWRIGRFLAGQLGAIVPEPRWHVGPCDEFPHGLLGYRKLPGATPAWGTDPGTVFARDLGAFMARLHGIAVDAARAAGVPQVDSLARVLGARKVVMPVLAARFERRAFARIGGWWSSIANDERMRSPDHAVCHHDLWHDNLLRSDEGRLTGVLDLAHVEISDPAHVFGAPRYFGEDFMADLLDAYRAAGGRFDDDTAYRARRFYEAREFGGLAWAIEHDDQTEIESALDKIRRGPLLSSG